MRKDELKFVIWLFISAVAVVVPPMIAGVVA